MSTQLNNYFSPEEYLALERTAEYKSEYVDGIVYAMSGASLRHNTIAANVIAELVQQLRDKPCRVLPSDMKVRMPDSSKFFYPDVSVVCGELQFHDDRRDISRDHRRYQRWRHDDRAQHRRPSGVADDLEQQFFR